MIRLSEDLLALNAMSKQPLTHPTVFPDPSAHADESWPPSYSTLDLVPVHSPAQQI